MPACARRARYAFGRLAPEERRHLLFEQCANPGETTDLAGERPELVQRLSRALHGWRKIQME